MGMRKDFIMSEEDKRERRKHIDENRKLLLNRSESSDSQAMVPFEGLKETLDEIDRVC